MIHRHPDSIAYPATRERPELLIPERSGDHVWVTVVAFVSASDTMRKAFNNSEQVLLDSENIASVSSGCYICEEPFSIRLSFRECKGEPNE
jgi:hypothetical protein